MTRIIKKNNGALSTKNDHTNIVWARVDAVFTLLLENDRYMQMKRVGELISLIMEKFNVSQRTAERYVAEAKDLYREHWEEKKEDALTKQLTDMEYVIQTMKLSLKNATTLADKKKAADVLLSYLIEKGKLKGLYVTEIKQSGELTIKNVDLSRLTEHGLERIKRGDKIEEVLIDPKSIRVSGV